MDQQSNLVEVRGLKVDFMTTTGLFTAVNAVDLDIRRGEGMATQAQRLFHVVDECGFLKTRHALAAVELMDRRVALVQGVVKGDHGEGGASLKACCAVGNA